MGVATFLICGYQSFVSEKSMLKKLYGEEGMQEVYNGTMTDEQQDSP